MHVPKEAFTGGTTAALTRGLPHEDGLSIRIRAFIPLKALEEHEGKRLGEIIERCIRYSGLTATLEGFPQEVPTVVLPRIFLDHALEEHKGQVTAVMSETVHGVTIKLARVRGEFWRMDKTKINFFGKVISLSDTQARHQIPAAEKTVELNTEKKAFVETSFCTIVLIDVHDTSRLKLKLPERDVLIQDEGLDLIWKAVELLYCRMISNPAIVNGLPADHPLRGTSPYPLPRPSCVVSNLAGTSWMPVDGGLIAADGDRLERHEIVSVTLDSYHVQESGYLQSMFENIVGSDGCAPVTRVMFEDREIDQALGKGLVPHVVGNTLVIKAEGDEIHVPLDDGESGYALEYTEVGGAIGDANVKIDDLYNTVVEDLALMFTIEDPHGDSRTLSAPIAAIYFNPDWDTYDPFVIIAKGREDEVQTRMLRGVPWYNDEGGDYSLQEENHSASFATLIAKITGTSRSHFQREVQSAVQDKAYSLMSDVEGDEETIVLKVMVSLKKGGSPVVTVERDAPVQAEAA
ncbi:hypothetical protein [Microvirga calopogonii]|uniref:hypothetical protein n=1 Tax=Microvirga calopogonii TaxID=2078013 RepID=UPI000E0D1A34|nr:hypothetical protein [Microvirga calopogonii]